ncbi:MAG: aminotransferase class I/II-fold pyridoxal phosphate-dependent enzyme [Flavobacteriaceae bacterium]|nr:aminotransferase class I/II-fold pyridoxal phosphate-dependent enzyme [Flavobacteriaceae bacterium]
MKFPNKLKYKIHSRVENKALRTLGLQSNLIDFSSNDYLGFAKSETIFDGAHQFLVDENLKINGATGSRLLSGDHWLYDVVEKEIAEFHQSEAALIFNSGYDANLGFFSSVPQRGDVIIYDEFIHASIRDGIQLSNAKAYKFKHNDVDDLKPLLKRHSELVSESDNEIYVVTESVFSMDGDMPDLVTMSQIIKYHNAFFVVDEAHAIGVFGEKGCGEVQRLGIENLVFARIITFGKGLGCHGAAILGSQELKQYLVNFARSFVYTTGLAPHALATIKMAYNELVILNKSEESQQQKLQENISFFKSEIRRLQLQKVFIESNSAIHCCLVPGIIKPKKIANQLHHKGYDVRAILSPTVSVGEERLRFCLHAYNSKKEITEVLENLRVFMNN